MKNRFTQLCAFIFLLFNSAQAQEAPNLDSLLEIYNNSNSADTLKIAALYQLFDAYMYHDQEKAGYYLSLVHDIASSINDESEMAKCNGTKGALFDILGQPDSSLVYYKLASDYYEKNEIRDKLEIVRFNQAMVEMSIGNFDEAIKLANLNIISPELVTQESAPNQAMSYGLLSRVYRNKGFYKLSLKNALIALKIIETTGDELRIADALKDLAHIESALLHYEKSNEYHEKSIGLYEKNNDKYFLAASKNGMGENFIQLENNTKALELFNESISLAKDVGSIEAQASALNNIGKIHIEKGQFELGLNFLTDAIVLCEKSGLQTSLHETRFLVGNLYSKWGKHEQALRFYDEYIAYANSIEKKGSIENAYLARAKSYELIGDLEASLQDYTQAYNFSNTNYDIKQVNAIEELRAIHDIQQKEKEIQILASKAELDKVKSTRLWISLFAVTALGTILFWAQWTKRRKEKEIEFEKQRVVELENQNLNYELDFKKQELTSKVLQLCRKNEFLQSLEKEIKEFRSETEGTERHRLEKLSRKINQDMNAATDWEQFLKSFESVHPDFNKILLQKYPNFAPNEVRMACLMRMNLESKDIAQLLNVSPDSVKKARYRMRKKMEKDSSVNLTEYFMQLEDS